MSKDFSPSDLFPPPKDLDRAFEKFYLDAMRDVDLMAPEDAKLFKNPIMKALLQAVYIDGARYVMDRVARKCREAAKEKTYVHKPSNEVH